MKKSIAYLKNKFLNGKKPPQDDFHDWLDSFVHLDNQYTPTIANQTEAEAAATTTPVTDISNTILVSLRALRYFWDKAISLFTPRQYFDCTVGTGGDYPATSVANGLEQAIADGKKSVKFVSNVSLFSNITIANGTKIYIQEYTLTGGSYQFINNTGRRLYFEGNGNITFGYSSVTFAKAFFKGAVYVTGVNGKLTITNTSTAAGGGIGTLGEFRNIKAVLPNTLDSGFGFYYGDRFTGLIEDSEIVGGGTNCSWINCQGATPTIRNIKLSGSFESSNGQSSFLHDANYIYGSAIGRISLYNGQNFKDILIPTMNITFFSSDVSIDNARFATLNINSKAGNMLTKLRVSNALTIDGQNNFLQGTFGNTINITAANNTLEGKFNQNISIAGTADSTKITGRLETGKTITLAAGTTRCVINVFADSTASILGSDGLPAVPGSANCDATNEIHVI